MWTGQQKTTNKVGERREYAEKKEFQEAHIFFKLRIEWSDSITCMGGKYTL
jgi:hypothetical protein